MATPPIFKTKSGRGKAESIMLHVYDPIEWKKKENGGLKAKWIIYLVLKKLPE